MSSGFSLGTVEVSSSPQERFADFLQSKGKRITQQRRILIDFVFKRHDHFDAEELIMNLAQVPEGRKVSRPTVYRTLNELVDSGLLTADEPPRSCHLRARLWLSAARPPALHNVRQADRVPKHRTCGTPPRRSPPNTISASQGTG